MTYNIHPIIVHFPIAFLSLYSIIALLPLNRFLPKISWNEIERVLLVFGVLGAFFALSSGEIAEHLVRPNHDLVETHSLFAGIATWTYVLLLFGEVSKIFNKSRFSFSSRLVFFVKISKIVEKVLEIKFVRKLIIFVGFLSLIVAGLLGGVLVYGVSADPFAPFVLSLFGISL